MKIVFKNISIADQQILEMSFANNKCISLIIKDCLELNSRDWLGKIQIDIYSDSVIRAEKYEKSEFSETEELTKMDFDNFEVFYLIQEIKENSGELILSGWSKKSDAWLIYTIKNYEYSIQKV